MDKYTAEPVIGILSQETASVEKYFFLDKKYTSFIAASYVKFLECGGARIIPVLIGQDEEYYKRVVQYTNGLLLPGGGTWFYEKKGYAEAGRMLYNIALKLNRNGDYYPIWGTCLGMELLAYLCVDGEDPRSNCSCKNISLPLNFRGGFTSSKLFQSAPEKVINVLRFQNVTYNFHRFCLTEEKFIQFEMNKDWRILATNKDVNGLEFISCFESIQYPFYGVQFHPEKNQFEFKKNNYAHTWDAVEVAQYFANFFVEECRKNDHKFPDWDSLQKRLIYNYPLFFSGRIESFPYQQIYMFRAPRIYLSKKSIASQTEATPEILLVQPLEAPEAFQDQAPEAFQDQDFLSARENPEDIPDQSSTDIASQKTVGSSIHESVQCHDMQAPFPKAVESTEQEIGKISIFSTASQPTALVQPPLEASETSVHLLPEGSNVQEQSTELVQPPIDASETSVYLPPDGNNIQEQPTENSNSNENVSKSASEVTD